MKTQRVGCRDIFILAFMFASILPLCIEGFLLSQTISATCNQIDNYPGVDPPIQTSTDLVSTIVDKVNNSPSWLTICFLSNSQRGQQIAEAPPKPGTDQPVTAIQYPGNLVALGLMIVIIFQIAGLFVGFLWMLRSINRAQLETVEKEFLPSSPALAEKLKAYFDIGELEILCFELKIDYDEIGGDTKSLKVIKLVGYCERRGRLQELIERAKRHRPHVPWP